MPVCIIHVAELIDGDCPECILLKCYCGCGDTKHRDGMCNAVCFLPSCDHCAYDNCVRAKEIGLFCERHDFSCMVQSCCDPVYQDNTCVRHIVNRQNHSCIGIIPLFLLAAAIVPYAF